MKKTELKHPETPSSDPKDNPKQPYLDKLSQDVLNDEELEEVSGGISGNSTGRRVYKPILITTPVGQASP